LWFENEFISWQQQQQQQQQPQQKVVEVVQCKCLPQTSWDKHNLLFSGPPCIRHHQQHQQQQQLPTLPSPPRLTEDSTTTTTALIQSTVQATSDMVQSILHRLQEEMRDKQMVLDMPMILLGGESSSSGCNDDDDGDAVAVAIVSPP
jgi:hypothetical protein